MRKIQDTKEVPELMELANIITLYKGKGSRFELDNDRGIFILTILRMIHDRIIYNDIYEKVDKSMSDAQVGGRRNRGIRNHLFMLYSIINSVKNKECGPVDLQIYDVTKCFDKLWLMECCQDLFEAGVTDDKLTMIYNMNKTNQVAVQTPGVGLTERVEIPSIVTQGGCLGPIMAGVSIDTIGKDTLNGKNTVTRTDTVSYTHLTLPTKA